MIAHFSLHSELLFLLLLGKWVTKTQQTKPKQKKLVREFNYRPPYKFLIVGLGGLSVALLFAMAIGKNEFWFSMLMILFCILTAAMGIGFLLLFFSKSNVGKLKIAEDHLVIPNRWKPPSKVLFSDIEHMEEFNTYDHVLEIHTQKKAYLIERQWMNKQDFQLVRAQLIEISTEKGRQEIN